MDARPVSPEVTRRTLLLLRHAKAEQMPGKLDHDRELAPRGRRDARAVGSWLEQASQSGMLPLDGLDLALCSTSERTRQTLEAVRAGGARVKDMLFDERIYDAGAAGLLEVLRETPDPVETVLMVGHAPGIPVLAAALLQDVVGSGDGGHDGAERLARGFPTSGLAVLTFEGQWRELAPESAHLVEFVVPRG